MNAESNQNPEENPSGNKRVQDYEDGRNNSFFGDEESPDFIKGKQDAINAEKTADEAEINKSDSEDE